LFAALMRLVHATIGVAATLNRFDVLRSLSGADSLKAAFTGDQLLSGRVIPTPRCPRLPGLRAWETPICA
jgi:hypothetical protein